MNQQRMLFDTVTDWCDRNDWSYDVVEEGAVIRSGFSGDNGASPVHYCEPGSPHGALVGAYQYASSKASSYGGVLNTGQLWYGHR